MTGYRRILGYLVALGVVLALTIGPARAREARSTSDRYLVLIVMDGFRPDYMRLAPMPHLQALMRTGMSYNRAWVGQLETETPTGHATIVTGVYPRKHSVIGFGWRSVTTGGFVWMPTDLRQLSAGAMEALIEAGGAPSLSDLMHRRYPGSKSVALSGEKYYAADAMGAGADYILYGHALQKHGIEVLPIGPHVPPPSVQMSRMGTSQDAYPWIQDELVAGMATHLLATVRPRTTLVNFPGTDIEGHLTGGIIDHPDMRDVVVHADDAIGRIVDAYRRAGLYSKTLFVVTADHGMVPNSHIVPIKSMYAGLRGAAASLEDDFLTTGGYVFLRNPQDAAKVASVVAARHYPGVEGALYRVAGGQGYAFRADPATARTLGPALTSAYLDLANTLAAPAGPEVVLPYAEDTMGLTVKGSGPHWGNHGGLSWRTQHIPLILSGPGVRHGVSWFPAQLVDIAPTIERLLGLGIPPAVDGQVLADAEAHPGASDAAAQKAVGPQRSRDVRALMQHSRNEHGIALGL